MSSEKSIEHKGIIHKITNGRISVRFTVASACSSCHAKGLCSASEMSDKEISVPVGNTQFTPGEEVMIVMQTGQGLKAVAWGYIYPFLLLLILLLVFTATGMGELRAGIFALSSLLPYYSFLYLFRDKIHRQFNFSIRKIV